MRWSIVMPVHNIALYTYEHYYRFNGLKNKMLEAVSKWKK